MQSISSCFCHSYGVQDFKADFDEVVLEKEAELAVMAKFLIFLSCLGALLVLGLQCDNGTPLPSQLCFSVLSFIILLPLEACMYPLIA